MSTQNRDQTLIGLSEKINGFEGKLNLWNRKAIGRKFALLSTLNLLLENENFDFTDKQNIIIELLEKLVIEFERYIPKGGISKYNWVRVPFNFVVNDLPDDFINITEFKEQLVEVQSDEKLRYNFNKHTESLRAFWLNVKKEKPFLGNEALKEMLPLFTTCLYESGFSALTVTKT
jgi:hypothetical protein